eukprot:3611221-Rhodomonas_salina.1
MRDGEIGWDDVRAGVRRCDSLGCKTAEQGTGQCKRERPTGTVLVTEATAITWSHLHCKPALGNVVLDEAHEGVG